MIEAPQGEGYTLQQTVRTDSLIAPRINADMSTSQKQIMDVHARALPLVPKPTPLEIRKREKGFALGYVGRATIYHLARGEGGGRG